MSSTSIKDRPTVIRWADPPASRNVGNRGGRPADSVWNDVAETLRAERGRWAVLYEGGRPGARSVRDFVAEGRRICFRPAGDFEACMRSWDGVHTVYARYLGDGDFT